MTATLSALVRCRSPQLSASALDARQVTSKVSVHSAYRVGMDQDSAAPQCQRWRQRQQSWRPAGEGGFNRARYDVVELDEVSARAFTCTHHYSASWPAARLRYGLIDLHTNDTELVGVCVLGVPMSKAVLSNPFPTLVPYVECLELSRLVLLDHVPANAESFFCARAFKMAATKGIRGIVAFADPIPRSRRAGQQLDQFKPGHIGTVYQSLSMRYAGRGTARSLIVLPDGSTLTARAAAKVTALESGWCSVVARLHALGGPAELDQDRPAKWLANTLDIVGAERLQHPGNHRYLTSTGPGRRSVTVGIDAQPYPKAMAARTPG